MAVAPDIARLIDEICDDRTHGASELARQAARVLKAVAERSQADDVVGFIDELGEVGQALMSARSSMAPIRNIVHRILSVIPEQIEAKGIRSLRQFAISRADEMIGDSLKAVEQIILRAREIVAIGDKVMTHSYSSTVVALLKDIASRGRDIDIIITRSGTGRTGEKIARELGDCGLPITFVDDTAVGLYMPMVNKVLLGADTVCTDGVVNGVGSYPLALMAARHRVPIYILADTLKFDTGLIREDVDVEDIDGEELIDPANLPQAVSVSNPHFDMTPLELITGVVTEQGIMAPVDVIAFLSD